MGMFTDLIDSGYRKKAIEVALDKGFQLLNVIDGDHGEFKRIDCGHIFKKQFVNMQHQKQTFCSICSEDEHERIMKVKDVSLVVKGCKGTNTYKVNTCGHTFTSTKANFLKRETKYECLVCYSEKEKQMLESMGLEMLSYRADGVQGKANPMKHAEYRFKECGHTFTYVRHAIQHGKQRCQTCTDIAAMKALDENGYYLVGNLAPVKITIGFKSCEHTRLVHRSAAVRGNCICQHCKVSAYVRPSKIYAIEFINESGSFIKYGYGKSVKIRLQEYGIQDLQVGRILFEIDVKTGNDALKIEKAVHSKYEDKRLDKEKMKRYFRNTGFTECYPMELLSELESSTLELLEREDTV